MSRSGPNIQLIKQLAARKLFDEALAKCATFLVEFPEARSDVLRARAYVYSLEGMYEQAIVDRMTIVQSGDAALRDYYQLGDNCLSVGDYEKASTWLNHALRLGREQKEAWFDSAAAFLLAYAQMQLGNLQEASEYLDQAVAADPECAMPIRNQGLVNHQQLREQIHKRQT